MSKILITGGNGFIGSRVASLLSKSHKVVLLDLVKNQKFDSLIYDITDNSWIDSVGKFDYVFHFASVGWGSYKASNPVKLIHTELAGLYNVLDYTLKNNTKKIIYSSSGLLSDEFKRAFTFSEIDSNPFFSYPAAKLMGEYFLKEFHKENNTGYSIVRYYTVYGENQHDGMAVPSFIRSAIEGKPIVVYGSGKQKRDFTYVGDAAKATILTAFSGNTFSKAVNIGTGKNTTLIETAKLIKKLTKSGSEIIHDNFPENLEALETERMAFSSSYLKELIGFECKTSLEQGLKKVINSIEENGLSE